MAEVSVSEKPFFVIYEEKEKSFSTVNHTEVIYDDHVKIGDIVTFFWCRKKHEGIVRYIGDTYEDCVEKSLKFNTEEKKKQKKNKEVLLHENEPRQSKIKCREKFLQIKKRKNSKSTQDKSKSKKIKDMRESARAETNDTVHRELLNMIKKKNLIPTALSKKEERNMSNICDDKYDHSTEQEEHIIQLSSSPSDTNKTSDTENDSNKEDSDNAFTDESSSDEHNKKNNSDKIFESMKLKKLASQLATKFDIQTLEKLLSLDQKLLSIEHNSPPRPENKIITHNQTESDNDCKILRSEFQSKHLDLTQMSEAQNEIKTTTGPQSSELEPTDKIQLTTDTQIVKSDSTNNTFSKIKISGLNNMFSGDMFLVKDPALGIALNEAKSIYCLQDKYTQAENATSATMAGRRLLDGVFTPEALCICSLSGMPPRGKGKLAYANKSSIKPYLCPKAVTAIIDKALQFQNIKHWRPKKDSSHIRQAMAVRINEVASQYTKENH